MAECICEGKGASAPFGYKQDERSKSHIVIDEEAAKVVRFIYQLAMEGNGVAGICIELNNDDVMTPRQYRAIHSKKYLQTSNQRVKKRKGEWAVSTVSRILHNPIYLGYLQKGNTNEPIISEEVFYQVQHQLKTRIKNQEGGHNSPHLLAGKVRCKECGCNMHKSSSQNKKGKKYAYLRCSLSYTTHNKDCTPHRIKYEILVDYLEHQIQERINQCTDGEMLEKWKDVENREKQRLDHQKETLDRQITELNKNFVTLYLDRLKGILTEEEFFGIKGSIERKKTSLEKELETLNQASETEGFCLSRTMLYSFIDYIEIGESDKIYLNIMIHWK